MYAKNLLVTGGAGFIGSHFLELLSTVENPFDEILVIDKLTYAGSVDNIQKLLDTKEIRFIHGDICDRELVDGIFKKHNITHVVNFAAESHVDRSITSAADFLNTNINGTFVLLESCRRHWQPGSNHNLYIQISTDEVFGSLGTEDAPFVEQSPYRPNSPYSASKASADHMTRAWFETHQVPTAITYCSNNYGTRQFPEKLIPLFISRALDGKSLPIYGNGQQIRDWIHVKDHCKGIWKVLLDAKAGEVFCFGAEQEFSNLQVAHLICDAVDRFFQRTQGSTASLITHVQDRAGHDQRYAINAEKAKTLLGWSPDNLFIDTLDYLVSWYAKLKHD